MKNLTKYKYDSAGNLWIMVPKARQEELNQFDDLAVAMVKSALKSNLIRGKLTATQLANQSGITSPTKSDLIKICKYLRASNYAESRDGAGKYFHI